MVIAAASSDFPDDPYTKTGERNLTIRQLIQLQRERLRSSNPVERFAASLLIPSELRKRLSHLNDREIGQLLDDEVVARMNVLWPESTICFAAANRLRRGLILSRRHKRLGAFDAERTFRRR
jgi:hypothetical protein